MHKYIYILYRFKSSSGDWTSLAEYVERMKDKQEQIFYIAGQSEQEVTESPFVERLLKKGYEVLYLTEAVDEYAISALPEFESKKFQNVAKEGVDIDGDSGAAKQRKEDLKERFVLILLILEFLFYKKKNNQSLFILLSFWFVSPKMVKS